MHRPHLDPAEPGERHLGRDLQGPLLGVDVDDVEAAEVLLGLDVGPVGHDRRAVLEVDRLGHRLVADAEGADVLAGAAQLLVERVGVGDELLDLVLRERRPQLFVAVDEQHVLHGGSPLDAGPGGRFVRDVGAEPRFSTSSPPTTVLASGSLRFGEIRTPKRIQNERPGCGGRRGRSCRRPGPAARRTTTTRSGVLNRARPWSREPRPAGRRGRRSRRARRPRRRRPSRRGARRARPPRRPGAPTGGPRGSTPPRRPRCSRRPG